MWLLSKEPRAKEPYVTEITSIGVDLAKFIFKVHGVDAMGTVIAKQRSGELRFYPSFQSWPRVSLALKRAGHRIFGAAKACGTMCG
jgi:hypothetical protein